MSEILTDASQSNSDHGQVSLNTTQFNGSLLNEVEQAHSVFLDQERVTKHSAQLTSCYTLNHF